MDFKSGDSVKVKGFGGIALTVLGPVQVWEPWTSLETDPETGEEFEAETGEGEWVDGDGSTLRVRMVGDDHVYEVEADECAPLEREAYCGICGQIGCGHDGLDRSESEAYQ